MNLKPNSRGTQLTGLHKEPDACVILSIYLVHFDAALPPRSLKVMHLDLPLIVSSQPPCEVD